MNGALLESPRSRLGLARLACLVALLPVACRDAPAREATPVVDASGASSGAAGSRDGGAAIEVGPSPIERREAPDFAPEDLEAHVAALADDSMNGRDEGTAGGIAARQLIIDALTGCGIPPATGASYEQAITTGRGTNVLARIPGADPALADRVILLGAHYDHLGACGGSICNGANDNAAAVAIVLEVACALAEAPPPKSVLVALWDAEEPPTFLTDAMGSEFYAAHPVVPLEDTDVAIALDLVGGSLWGAHPSHFMLGRESSSAVRDAVDAVAAPEGLQVLRGGLHLVEETPFGRQPWSDYHPFRERGVPTLFFSNGQNKRYHEVDDELDSLDLAKMALETKFLFAVTWALATSPVTPELESPARVDGGEDAETVRSILADALAAGGLVESLSLSAGSRAALDADLSRVEAVRARMARGRSADTNDVRALRRAAQRVMCLAGSQYRESVCGQL